MKAILIRISFGMAQHGDEVTSMEYFDGDGKVENDEGIMVPFSQSDMDIPLEKVFKLENGFELHYSLILLPSLLSLSLSLSHTHTLIHSFIDSFRVLPYQSRVK